MCPIPCDSSALWAYLILGSKLKWSQKERRKCSEELKQGWILRNTKTNPFPQQADAILKMPVRDELILKLIWLAFSNSLHYFTVFLFSFLSLFF